MLKLLIALVFTLSSTTLVAQDWREVMVQRNIRVEKYVVENSGWDKDRLQAEGGLFGPNNEFKDAIDFLYNQTEETRPFIKFFTSYTIPHSMRDQAVYTLSYELHSMVAWSNNIQPTYRPLAVDVEGKLSASQRVPGSSTLWWIDIRDFGWTNEAFEKALGNEPYFVPPIVDERLVFLLKAEGLSSNIIVRVDWAIANFMDPQRQIDRGQSPIYDTLIYSRLSSGAPTNKTEWNNLWKINNRNSFFTLVTKSKAVSLHNRVLESSQGRFGSHYESFDVAFQEGARDYLEDFFNFVDNKPRVSDAGEMIAENQLGMLVYGLRDGNNKLVHFGDPTVVRHPADIIDDVRVRVGHSCADCHSSGPLKAENTLVELTKRGVKIRVPDFDDKADVEAAYLGEGFNFSIEDGKNRYHSAMKRVNGLTPEQNGVNYLAAIAWYDRPVSLEQASVEVGIPQNMIRGRLQGKVSGRLALLVNNGEPIPRNLWDSPGRNGVPGSYQQLMVAIYGLVSREVEIRIIPEAEDVVVVRSKVAIIDRAECYKSNSKVPYRTVTFNDFDVISESGDWLFLDLKDGTKAWVRRRQVTSLVTR